MDSTKLFSDCQIHFSMYLHSVRVGVLLSSVISYCVVWWVRIKIPQKHDLLDKVVSILSILFNTTQAPVYLLVKRDRQANGGNKLLSL